MQVPFGACHAIPGASDITSVAIIGNGVSSVRCRGEHFALGTALQDGTNRGARHSKPGKAGTVHFPCVDMSEPAFLVEIDGSGTSGRNVQLVADSLVPGIIRGDP